MAEGRTVHLLFILFVTLAASALLLLLNVPTGYGSDPAISVNSTADDTDPNDGDCTLREAITTANTGTDSGAAAGECEAMNQPMIWFAIPTSDGNYDPADDFWTILPASPLPAITADGTEIDGYTQDQGVSEAQPNTNGPDQGSNAAIKIELDGVIANSDWGLRVDANDTSIRGFAIGRFDSVGVFVASGTANVIAGNFLGTNFSGTQDRGNPVGIGILTAANQVGGSSPADRNVISGNDSDGVSISGSGATGNTVHGNLIGLAASGSSLGNHTGVRIDAPGVNFIGGTTAAQRNVISANSVNGVRLESGEANAGNIVRGNYIGTTLAGDAAMGNGAYGVISLAPDALIGGTAPGSGNVIAGNGLNGVQLLGVRNVVQGNYIGVNAAGTAAIPNLSSGVKIGTSAPSLTAVEDNLIGGTSTGAGNVISGNIFGIEITGATTTGNVIQGNYLGTNAAGNVAIPTQGDIVTVQSGASDNTIGGPEAGAGNVISGGNQVGIALQESSGNLIQGNLIGTAADGASPLGNKRGGVRLDFGSDNNTISSNTIANNGFDSGNFWPGVFITGGVGNNMSSNEIHTNGALGIDLIDQNNGMGGVSPNDPMDPDTGFGNNVQNYPLLTSAASGSLSIEGTLDSTPNATFRVEFFVNDDCDSSGHGEGRDFLGAGTIATDGNGIVDFTANSNENVPVGKYITATATNLSTNDTSEFSNCVEVAAPPTPPPGETPSPTPEGQTPTPTPVLVETSTPTPTGTPAPTTSATATPAPTGTPPAGERLVWGDHNCSGSTDPVDSLLTLRFDAGLGTNTGGCPAFGQVVDVADASPHVWGDIDCSGEVTPVDSLKVLRFDAGLGVSQEIDCPPISSEVLVVD